MKFLVSTFLFFCLNANAESPTVNCDVNSLAEALACMEKVAETYQSYEEPNDGLVTQNTQGLVEALELLGASPEALQKARSADFAGIMVEHGDEHHIYYFAIQKGKSQVVELRDLNVVDFEYIIEKPYSTKALDPATYFLGIETSDIDAFDDVKERLEELESEGN